ncbi:MAG: BON domain-containing protein [Gammaproteobacteria bacterium]|nr:BON domain-containing protein [Gammaproteobacteria bacterium]
MSSPPLAAGGERDGETGLEVPPAAAGSLVLDDLKAPIRPQTYPALPSADPFAQDPDEIRAALRRDVERALAEEPELADTPILVHVTSLRRARLSGIVDSDSTRLLAEIVAASVNGISGVDNGLKIEAED